METDDKGAIPVQVKNFNLAAKFDAVAKFVMIGLVTFIMWGLKGYYADQKKFNEETTKQIHAMQLLAAESAGNKFTAVDWTRAKTTLDSQLATMTADRQTLTIRMTRNEDAVNAIKETLGRIDAKIDRLK